CRKPRALVADRVFHRLNENGLPLMHTGTDWRQHTLIKPCQFPEAARLARAAKACPLQPHFHESSLHARQHAPDAPEKDVTDQRMSGATGFLFDVVFHGPLKEQFHGSTILDDCYTRLAGTDIDQDFFRHETPGSYPPHPRADGYPVFTLDRFGPFV